MTGHRIAACIIGVLAVARAAHADPPQPQNAGPQNTGTQKAGTDLAAAESLFREGKAAMAQKRYEEACSKFAESNRLDPQMGTLLNLAYCHESAGKTASAWGEFNEVAAQAARAGQTGRAGFAKQHAAAVEAKLSRVKLTGGAADSTVKVDGKVVGAAVIGSAIPMDPGTHRLEVSAPGKKSREATFDVPQGPSSTEVPVPSLESAVASDAAPAPGPAEPEPAPREAPKSSSSSGTRTAGFVLGGVGIAGIAAGAVFGVIYLGKASDYNDCHGFCGGTAQSDQDKKSSAQTMGWISTAAFGVGVVGLATGTILLLTSKSSASKEQARGDGGGHARSAPEAKLQLRPVFAPHQGAVSLEGNF